MKCSSAELQKLLRQLQDDEAMLAAKEKKSFIFNAAVGEDVEAVRPEYNLIQHSTEVAELQYKIRILKHALNVFNNTTVLEDFDMTIDQALVALPQLRYRQTMLREMIGRQPIERVNSYGAGRSALIDYRYINYNMDDAKKLYEEITDQIAALQLAIDEANLQQVIDVNIGDEPVGKVYMPKAEAEDALE